MNLHLPQCRLLYEIPKTNHPTHSLSHFSLSLSLTFPYLSQSHTLSPFSLQEWYTRWWWSLSSSPTRRRRCPRRRVPSPPTRLSLFPARRLPQHQTAAASSGLSEEAATRPCPALLTDGGGGVDLERIQPRARQHRPDLTRRGVVPTGPRSAWVAPEDMELWQQWKNPSSAWHPLPPALFQLF